MATSPQPIPERQYIFTAGTPAVADQVNHELNTLYSVLQGGIGDQHIADQANIQGSKVADDSLPASKVLKEPWTDYTVTGTAFGGMSFAVTNILVARYKQVGNSCELRLQVEGTTAGTASNSIIINLPVPALDVNGVSGAYVSDGGPISGFAYVLDANHMGFQRYDAANFSLGTDRRVGVFITYETA